MPRWPDDRPTVEAAEPAELRAWLSEHHEEIDAAWFRYWKATSGRPSLTWSEVVDELLCWGWIDSKSQAVDADSHVQYIARRKPGSVWSRINREQVERLIAEGRMNEAPSTSVRSEVRGRRSSAGAPRSSGRDRSCWSSW